MQLQQQRIHQPPKHGTAPPQPNSPLQDLCPRRIQSPKAADDDYTKGSLLFFFSLFAVDYQDQRKPEEGQLQTQHLPWRQTQPPRTPAKLCPSVRPSAGDLPTQGQAGLAPWQIFARQHFVAGEGTDTDRYFVSSRAPGDCSSSSRSDLRGGLGGSVQGWMTGEKTEGSVYTGPKSLLTRWKR